MDPTVVRLIVASALIALVAGAALVMRSRHARRRRAGWAPPVSVLHAEDVPSAARFPLTLVYFTSPLCSDCKEVPGLMLDAAPEVPVVAVDVRQSPDAARRYDIRETPTLILVDDRLRIRWAHVGLADPQEVWLYVREAWDSTHVALRRSRLGSRSSE